MSEAGPVHVDASVLVAALYQDDPDHQACTRLLRKNGLTAWTHALTETFATLTGGRASLRIAPGLAAELIESSLRPRLRLIELDAKAIAAALASAETVGARGGAIYDFLHLRAAVKAGARSLQTLNLRHFQALSRPGDPLIELPR